LPSLPGSAAAWATTSVGSGHCHTGRRAGEINRYVYSFWLPFVFDPDSSVATVYKVDGLVMQNHYCDSASILEKNRDFDVTVKNRYSTSYICSIKF